MSILLHILKRSVTPWERYMGFSLGEPERIYNMCLAIMSRMAEKLCRFVTYPEALSNAVETLHGIQPG